MKIDKEKLLFVCSIVGGVADLIAIIAVLSSWSFAYILLLLSFALTFIALVSYIIRYKKKFIEYLFNNPTHNFNLLPKICLAIDQSTDINDLIVRDMAVSYVCDMSSIDLSSITPTSRIKYNDYIEYSFDVENKKLPKQFFCYLGNLYSDTFFGKISQKHGIQSEYELIPTPRYTDETVTRSNVQKYVWQLKPDNFQCTPTVPINFKIDYAETSKANSNDTIILYPRQFAKKVERITFNFSFICSKRILKRVQVFRISQNNRKFSHIPIAELKINNNSAQTTIIPDSSKYEVYYFRIYWDMTT